MMGLRRFACPVNALNGDQITWKMMLCFQRDQHGYWRNEKQAQTAHDIRTNYSPTIGHFQLPPVNNAESTGGQAQPITGPIATSFDALM
jgi:hypothetical protein